jgi:hypothetical protein
MRRAPCGNAPVRGVSKPRATAPAHNFAPRVFKTVNAFYEIILSTKFLKFFSSSKNGNQFNLFTMTSPLALNSQSIRTEVVKAKFDQWWKYYGIQRQNSWLYSSSFTRGRLHASAVLGGIRSFDP